MQILVKTPLTTNGTDPILDNEGKRIFSESILQAPAKKILERDNEKLPQHLRRIIEDIPDTVAKPIEPPTQPQAKKAVTA